MTCAYNTIEILDKILFAPLILCSDFVFLISVKDGTIVFVLA